VSDGVYGGRPQRSRWAGEAACGNGEGCEDCSRIDALKVELYEVVRWASAWKITRKGVRCPEDRDESGERLPRTRRHGIPEWSDVARLHEGPAYGIAGFQVTCP
jgi:hypothetical protein